MCPSVEHDPGDPGPRTGVPTGIRRHVALAERGVPRVRFGCRRGTAGMGRGRDGEVHVGRRGAVPIWLPLALLILGLLLMVQMLQRSAADHGLARIDTTRYRLHANAQWLSPAWTQELERILGTTRDLPTDDPRAISAFVDEVRALPFVAEVGQPEVQWPDGLSLPIKLYEPVACIRIEGRDFLPVASDGTVLGGYAYAPHDAYGGWLPTLGPHDRLPEAPMPGDRIEDPVLVAGLSIAESMWSYLDVQDLRQLGRIVIDASRPDAPLIDRDPGSMSPARLPGGVILELEHGRRVLFGRPPVPQVDGELPVGFKWAHLRRALGDVAAGRGTWSLLDARFDEPVLLDRAEVEALQQRLDRGDGR